ALFEREQVLSEAGRLVEALDSIKGFVNSYPQHKLLPEALYRSAELSLSLNDPAAAVGPLKRLILLYPSHIAAKKALVLVGEIKASGVAFRWISPEERLSRGKRLLDGAHYVDAAKEFSQLLKCGNDAVAESAAVQLAITQIKQKRFDGAEKVLSEYLKRKPDAKNEAEALYYMGYAAVRRDDIASLLKIEKRLEERAPDSPELAGVLLLAGHYFDDSGERAKAGAYYRRIISEFSESPSVVEAYWKTGWAEYLAGNYNEAIKAFAPALKKNVKPARMRSQMVYWYARASEKSGRTDDAAGAYELTCGIDKKSYYCQLSEERLAGVPAGSISGAGGPVKQVPAGVEFKTDVTADDGADAGKSRVDISFESRYQAAAELIVLGQNSKASAELGLLSDEYKGDRTAIMEIGWLLQDAGDYASALTAYRRLMGGGPDELSQAACVLIDELGYPMRLVESIKQNAPEGPADPFLVAAIMREESGFNPEAVSPVGALGVMQIMPKTGEASAKEAGAEYSGPNDLFKPEVSIRLGSWYLGNVSRLVGNDLVLTIASYNAGPRAVLRWGAPRPDDVDEFIENIPYSETRYYVKRVIRTYAEYLKLAGFNPKDRWTRPFITPLGGARSVSGGQISATGDAPVTR
ncbi:tetratricopeptide repeat protein, partial [bacterium]